MTYSSGDAVSDQDLDICRSITQNLTDTDNLMKLLEEPAEIVDRPNATELQTVKGTVEFKDVCFSYDGKIDALKNVNFVM